MQALLVVVVQPVVVQGDVVLGQNDLGVQTLRRVSVAGDVVPLDEELALWGDPGDRGSHDRPGCDNEVVGEDVDRRVGSLRVGSGPSAVPA